MNSTETFIDGWDGISSEGWDLIEGNGYAIGDPFGYMIDLNPISI